MAAVDERPVYDGDGAPASEQVRKRGFSALCNDKGEPLGSTQYDGHRVLPVADDASRRVQEEILLTLQAILEELQNRR